MREWNNAAFDSALKTAEKIAGAPLGDATVEWMRWAFIQAWMSPHGYRYEVRHDDATIGPVSWDQLVRAHAEDKLPQGAEARVVGTWTPIAHLLAGRSLDMGDFESSRSFFEEADGPQQLVQRWLSASTRLPNIDDALRLKIEGDALERRWSQRDVVHTELVAVFDELVLRSRNAAVYRACQFGEHGFACLHRGALALALTFHDEGGNATKVMTYTFRRGDGYRLVCSIRAT